MFFTQEDYKKIQNWLQNNAIKDSEFDTAEIPLRGNETVTLVQNGKNVKVFFDDLIKQLLLLGMPDFINLTEKFNKSHISLSEAINLIPLGAREIGQVITFIDEDGNWRLYQFQGKSKFQWYSLSLWVDLIAEIAVKVNIVPDEEDVTGVKVGDATVIKLKNKKYNPEEYSGLGRTYLRKNIQDGKNVLAQNMLSDENTIYIIQYDYDLNGYEINVPEGCVLKFEGGSVKNGTIKGDSTRIIGNADFSGVTFNGTYIISVIEIEWFRQNGIITTESFLEAVSLAKCTTKSTPNTDVGTFVYNYTYPILKCNNHKISGVKNVNLYAQCIYDFTGSIFDGLDKTSTLFSVSAWRTMIMGGT